MKQMEINFVGSGNAVSISNILQTPIGNIFQNNTNYNIGMSSFIYEIDKNFSLKSVKENDLFYVFVYESEELDCTLKIRVSKEPSFVKLNQEEYDEIINLIKRRMPSGKGVVYNKTSKKILTPGKIVLATVLSAVVIIGGIKIVSDIKEAANDPNNILYNFTHYVSTVPEVPSEIVEEQLRQQQQQAIQEEKISNLNIHK